MIQMASSSQDMSTWDSFAWRRKMETFGGRDEAVVAQGAQGEIEGIWCGTNLRLFARKVEMLTGIANPAS